LRDNQLRLCGLTESEVLAQLRRDGVASVSELRYMLYETKGELTIVREPGDGTRTRSSYGLGCEMRQTFGNLIMSRPGAGVVGPLGTPPREALIRPLVGETVAFRRLGHRLRGLRGSVSQP
ncbi:MAG TPA: YetF domain-containing protein, partial [Pseudonocardiaceae bacterium]